MQGCCGMLWDVRDAEMCGMQGCCGTQRCCGKLPGRRGGRGSPRGMEAEPAERGAAGAGPGEPPVAGRGSSGRRRAGARGLGQPCRFLEPAPGSWSLPRASCAQCGRREPRCGAGAPQGPRALRAARGSRCRGEPDRPRPDNKSYLQKAEWFVFFRSLLEPVPMPRSPVRSAAAETRSVSPALRFWLGGNGFKALVTISVHLRASLGCFRTRSKPYFQQRRVNFKENQVSHRFRASNPFRSQK